MKIIRFCVFVLLLNHLLIDSVCAQDHEEGIPDSLFISSLIHVLEDYYMYYYQYPDSTQQVFEFVEDIFRVDEDKSLYFLDPTSFNNYYVVRHFLRASSASISKSDEYINVVFGGLLEEIPVQEMGFQVCDIDLFIGDIPREYHAILSRFSIGRFIDVNGKSVILTRKLNSELKGMISSLQREYLKLGTFATRKYQYEDAEVPINAVMLYDIKDGLRYYCLDKSLDNKLAFYRTLEYSLKEFCKRNNLSKVYFLTPDYYFVE